LNCQKPKTASSSKLNSPGLEEKDIDVSLSGDILTIKGEKKQEKKEEKKEEKDHYHYAETFYGSFQRSFRLPAGVKADNIDAHFDKGVLKIALPKTEEAKKKETKIKVK
jgi:HSP20 family protein